MQARMTGVLSNLWPWKRESSGADDGSPESREEQISRVMRPYEAFVVRVQSLLIWENPLMSCIFVLAVNLFFWLLVTLEFRFYSMASLLMLLVFIYNLWVEQIWPEIRVAPEQSGADTEGWTPLHPRVLSVPELSHHVSRAQNLISSGCRNAVIMRQEQPAKFCAVACSVLLVLLFVGSSVSGTLLAYLVLMVAILLPGVCIHLLPPDTMDKMEEVKSKLMGLKSVLMCTERDNVMTDSDSLMPDVRPEDMSLLNFQGPEDVNEDDEIAKLLPAGEISAIHDHDDKMLHSLTPSFSYMPGHDEDSMDCAADLPIDLDSRPSRPEDKSGIRFRSRHFNGDDSSDDDSFSKGLAFSDAAVRQEQPDTLGPFGEMIRRAAVENVAKTLVDAMTSVAHSVVASASAPKPSAATEPDSEDEMDDFEIINQEDLPKFS